MSGPRIHLPEEPTEVEIRTALESGDDVLYAWGHLLNGTNYEEEGSALFTAGVEKLLDLGRIVNADYVIDNPDTTDRQYDFVPDCWGLTESMIHDITEMKSGAPLSMHTEINDEETTISRGLQYADNVLTGIFNARLPPRMMALLDPEEIVMLWYSATVTKKGRHIVKQIADFHQLVAKLNGRGYPVLSPITSKWPVRYSHARGRQAERLEALPNEVKIDFVRSVMKGYVNPPKGEMEDERTLCLYNGELIFQPDFYPTRIIELVQNMWDTGGLLTV